MKVISKKLIQKWYKEEYSKSNLSSIYGKPVPTLLKFFDILDKDRKVKKILELGCGDGRNLLELAKRGYQVVGVDLYGKDTVQFRSKALGFKIEFIIGDIAKLHFEKQKYQGVISSEVFHLMSRKDVEKVIVKMKKAMIKGGYVYISILSNLKRYFLKMNEEFKYEDQSEYTSSEAKKLLQQKFRNWKVIELNVFHDEQDWPVKKGKYPIEPYHWSGDYVYIIAQKA